MSAAPLPAVTTNNPAAKRANSSFYLKQVEIAPETTAKMADQLQASLDKITTTKYPVWKLFETTTGKSAITSSFAEIAKDFGDLLGKETARGINQGKLLGQQMDTQTLYAGARNPLGADLQRRGWPQEGGAEADRARSQIRTAITDLDLFMRSQDGSIDKLAKIKAVLDGMNWTKAFPMKSDQLKAATELQNMYDAAAKHAHLNEEQKANATPIIPQQDLNRIKEELNNIQPASDAARNKLSAVNQVSMDDLISQIEDATTAMVALSQAAAQMPNPDTMTAAHGGMAYLAKGGRGTDTVPAMLSPGEFVMSAKASQQWSSQLIAMNAGLKPAYADKGGSVTNVGDISVTVNGGKSGVQTGRDIAQSLRRELRRQTSVL